MTAKPPVDPRDVVRWIRAITIVFFLMGFGFGTWLSRLPSLRDILGASMIEMSVYGLFLAAGSLLGMLLSARAVERFGPQRMMQATIAVQVVALPLTVVFMSGGAIAIGVAALFVFGLMFSATDVAMNVSGAHAERVLGAPRLPLMHAFYSIGAMLSMGIGAATEALRVSLPLHFIAVALVLGVVGFFVLDWVPRNESELRPSGSGSLLIATGPVPIVESATADTLATVTGSIPVIAEIAAHPAAPAGHTGHTGAAAPKPKRKYNPWRDPRVLLIGTITLSAGFIEGTPADWLPLALVDGRGATNEFGALVLALFYGAVVASRLAGSALLLRFSRVTLLRTSLAVAAVGVLTLVLVPGTTAMILGTIVWGLGAGICWPITISAAADRQETAARDVATVSAIGYASMLLGPMAFGVLGENIGLLTAFLVLPLFIVLAISLAGVTREPAAQAAR